ncbi:hypothetical protein STEG23_016242, partial [Scotinomys teguina]
DCANDDESIYSGKLVPARTDEWIPHVVVKNLQIAKSMRSCYPAPVVVLGETMQVRSTL